jgi:hypothetical protein
MVGQHMTDSLISVMKSTIGYIMGPMNLPDETSILTELSHFGASQKEDSLDLIESKKPTFIIT